jgi:hypothetical protein
VLRGGVLLQKPWHPLNFRNQARVWEVEQEHYATEKRKEEAKVCFHCFPCSKGFEALRC